MTKPPTLVMAVWRYIHRIWLVNCLIEQKMQLSMIWAETNQFMPGMDNCVQNDCLCACVCDSVTLSHTPVPPYLSVMFMSKSFFKSSIILMTSSLPLPAAHMNAVRPSRSGSSRTEGCFRKTATVSLTDKEHNKYAKPPETIQ